MKLSKGTNALSKLPLINWFEEVAEDKVVYQAYMKSVHTHNHLLCCCGTISKTLARQIAGLWPRTYILCNWSVETCWDTLPRNTANVPFYTDKELCSSCLTSLRPPGRAERTGVETHLWYLCGEVRGSAERFLLVLVVPQGCCIRLVGIHTRVFQRADKTGRHCNITLQ